MFEAAGRLGSFTAAAEELGITQAAVSQRIRNLEQRIGAQLFTRLPRGVMLSAQGESWLPHVQGALAQLLHSTANLFQAPRRKVTIAASASIIELWLVPRLGLINRKMPHVQLAFETMQLLPDYTRSDADLEIRFGEGNWVGREARRLFHEELTPIAAPVLVGSGAADWRSLPRIATSGPRLGWRDWTSATGEGPAAAPLLRFDTFVQAMRAAEAGAGVLLASLALCGDALEAGRLVRLTDKTLRMEASYWITWARSKPPFAERSSLVDFLSQPPGAPPA